MCQSMQRAVAPEVKHLSKCSLHGSLQRFTCSQSIYLCVCGFFYVYQENKWVPPLFFVISVEKAEQFGSVKKILALLDLCYRIYLTKHKLHMWLGLCSAMFQGCALTSKAADTPAVWRQFKNFLNVFEREFSPWCSTCSCSIFHKMKDMCKT